MNKNDDVVVMFGFDEPEIAGTEEYITKKTNQKEEAKRLISTLVASKGGHFVGDIHGNEIFTLPLEQLEVVKEIHQRLEDEIFIMCNIGIGEDSQEAQTAMEYTRDNTPGHIKVYNKDMEVEESIQKSEKYVPVQDEEKQKIAQIIGSMQQNKSLLDQMKVQSPEVYASIVSVVQSLSSIMQKDKEERAKFIENIGAKINDHISKQHARSIDKQGKEIDKHLNRENKESDKAKREKLKKLQDLYSKLHSQKRRDAHQFAKKVGHDDPEFLMKLLHAFRD